MSDRYRDKPFSEDEHGRDGYNRAPQRPAAESDPLAELARLIGQTDPFSTFGREQQQQQPPQYNERSDHYPSDDAHGYDEQPGSAPAWMRNLQPERDAYNTNAANDPYADDYGHPQQSGQQQDYGRDARYEAALYGEPDRDARREAPFQVQNDRYDEFDGQYDDEPDAPKARRGGTVTVMVVLALAVVGTGAAFAYRTFVGSPRSGEPPVIRADAGPNKIVPSGSGDKQITDRLGDRPQERVVSREEQPVDINGKAQPRVVFPALTQNANTPAVTSANTASRPTGAGVGNGTLGGDEPRKIRTLSIRPGESADATATANSASAAPAAVRQIPAATRAAPAAQATAPAASNGPISLTPQTSQAAPAPAPRVASVAPAASAPVSTGGGGSYVQVSSQKTEADAQASFRAIQAKYSGILGGKPSSIRRADLGDKGVFYRAVVGPFASTDEATQFCVNLKSAGGQCLVQR